MSKLEKLYEQSLMKWGFNWLPATPSGTYLHSYDEFKQKMESDKEMYNKVVEELNQTKMKELDKYVGECFHIDFEPKQNSFKVFTVPTQHFYIESLGELTPERFELEIKKQNELREQTRKNLIEVFEWKKKNQNKDE